MTDTKISALTDGSPVLATDMFVIARAGVNYKIPSSQIGSVDGWIDDTAETWTFVSATSFKVSGVDVTAKYTPGTRIKLTQTTVKYFVVVSSAFSTDTTVTIAAGSDYTLVSAAISANYHSYAANPQGYPGWFRYSPTLAGVSSPSVDCQFSVVGRMCTLAFGVQGTSTATTKTMTLPVPYGGQFTNAQPIRQMCSGRDSGVVLTTPSRGDFFIGSSTTLLTFFKDTAGNAWTASGTWYCFGLFNYNI